MAIGGAELPIEFGSRHPDFVQLPYQRHPAFRVRGGLEPGGEEQALEREVALDPGVDEPGDISEQTGNQ